MFRQYMSLLPIIRTPDINPSLLRNIVNGDNVDKRLEQIKYDAFIKLIYDAVYHCDYNKL